MTSVLTDDTQTESDGSVHFGQVELDLIATFAGADFPFPLRIPSFGRIAGEREVLFATAGHTLFLRGLATDREPIGPAAELVTALREYRGTVDLVLTDAEGTHGVVALVYRSWAMICDQRLDGDLASTVRVRRVPETALVGELLALVPEVAPARSMPISLPARAVHTAVRLIEDVEEDREKERRLRELVRDSGGDPDVLDQLVGLLPELTGRGQLGATRRTGESVRTGTELSWLDSPKGRVRVDRATDGWVNVNPLRQATVRFAIEDLATIARRPS
jgi:hypothetical protein